MSSQSKAKISVQPNPALSGGKVTIGGAADGFIFVGFKGTIKRYRLDKKGKLTIPAPGEPGDEFTVSDGRVPPDNVVIPVVSTV